MKQYQDRQVFRSDINLIKLVIGEREREGERERGGEKREMQLFYFNNCTVHLYYLYNVEAS
jgi:hypothetical protein